MYTLLSGLWRYLFQKDEYFVLVLGLDNAGKTTLVEQAKAKANPEYRMMQPGKITSTVGLNIGEVVTEGVRLKFWDLGGQEELRSLWHKYYQESHGLVYVVDSSEPERLEESWRALDGILDSEDLQGLPLLIICNKQDLPEALSVARIKTVFHESAAKLGRRDSNVLPASALSGHNVASALRWLVQALKANAPARPPVNQL